MMMFVTDQQYTRIVTDRLEGVLKAFYRGPSRANIRLDLIIRAGHFAHELAGDLVEVLCPLTDNLDPWGDHNDPVDQAHFHKLLCNYASSDSFTRPWGCVDQEMLVLTVFDKPMKGLGECFCLPVSELHHFRSFSQIASRTKRLPVQQGGPACLAERRNMIAMKRFIETVPTNRTSPARDQGEDKSLSEGKCPSQRLTQYSVSKMSRIGRLAGGFKTACLLMRTMAVA